MSTSLICTRLQDRTWCVKLCLCCESYYTTAGTDQLERWTLFVARHITRYWHRASQLGQLTWQIAHVLQRQMLADLGVQWSMETQRMLAHDK